MHHPILKRYKQTYPKYESQIHNAISPIKGHHFRQTLQLATARFDERTLEKMRACTKARFPVCLSETLTRMYGETGKKAMDRLIMGEALGKMPVSCPKDIWNLYEKYMKRMSELLGADVAEVIEYESLKDMERMLCTKCPLYEGKGSDLRAIE